MSDSNKVRAELVEALHMILACTPHAIDGEVVFDCGDPFEIARAALANLAKAEGSPTSERDAALEEAAKCIEDWQHLLPPLVRANAAKAIRALKTPPKETSEREADHD